MFRGSPGLSADQLANIAASMGGSFDADTQQSVTQYFFTVPAEDLDVALHIESIRMSGVLDSEELWEKERGAIEQEVARDLSNPAYVFYTQLLAAMFKGTVYAHDALGTTASFNETTAAMLRDFHKAWYAPNNAILVVVGKVDPGAVLKEIRQLFGGIPTKSLPERPPVELQPVKAGSLALKTDLPYGLALVCFRLPGSKSPDYAAARVMADVLSSQRADLYGLVPEGKALAAGFSMDALPEAGLGFAYAAYPAGGDGGALVKRMQDILAETLKKGVESDLVEAAKRRQRTQDQFRKNSIMGLAMEWSEALAVQGLESPQQASDALEKVTAGQVDEAARRYLVPDQSITAVLTPEPSGKPRSSSSFGGPESFAPAKTEAVELPAWAATAAKAVPQAPAPMIPTVSTEL